MPVTIKTVEFGGWQNCLQLFNDSLSLIVTSQVGPRVISVNMNGGENHMAFFEETRGITHSLNWHSLGGHRLWHSPEAKPRSYSPDTAPIRYEIIPDGVFLSQDVEPATGIRKEMTVTLHPERGGARVHHRLVNEGLWPVELSAWPITVMAPGGRAVMPQTRRETGLLPNRTMTLWPYTQMDDPRVFWGSRYIMLDQDPAITKPFKIGLSNEDGWAAYFNHNQLFIKRFSHQMDKPYPDGGCSCETYVCGDFLEMESLSPLTTLMPGGHIDHLEQWDVYDHVPCPSRDEAQVDLALKGRVVR